MVTAQAERKFGKRSMSLKNHMRTESGTCNVCSAPCSSCMHRNIAIMGSKIDEFSDETCRETTASHFSDNDNVGSKGRQCGSLQHAASEASNLLSANSSHDSFSVNAESKATVRSCDVSVTSEDFDAHPKLSSGISGAEDHLSLKPECVLDQRISSPKYDDTKGVEGHDDNMSSVSRANDANTAVIHDDGYVDIKNLSHGPDLDCSLGPEASAKTPFSQKLSSDFDSEKKADTGCASPKVQSPFSHSHGDKLLIGGFPEYSTKISLKSEAEVENDSGEPPDKAFKISGHDEHHLKFNDYMQPPLQALSGNESEESDLIEQDVKVCDICGDAGREDLLAICSKCSDGAEHTYCMKEMLQKLPEGEWLCEECTFAEETENQKQVLDMEGKRTNKIATQSFGKRQAENLEPAVTAKRLAVETSLGPAKSSNPTRTAALSRDSSFKSIDKGKIKPASFVNVSSNDISETARSPTGPLLQTPKGTLLKSNSFSTLNSKPKVKVVAEVVPQKQKGSREQPALDMKEGFSRAMIKSQSFKSTNFGRTSTSESKFRALSPRLSQELKGLKQVKERNVFDKKNMLKLEKSHTGLATASAAVPTPKVGQKLISHGESVPLSSAGNNRESKIVKSEGKVSMLSKSNSNLARRGAEVPASPVGASSMNGISSSAEQKPNLIIPKDEPASSSSWTADRPSNNVEEILQDGLPRSLESTTQGESVSLTGPTLTTGSKGVTCQKCKEMGHNLESCPQVSGIDVPARKNPREGMIKGNKLKAAIEAAMHKLPVSYGRNRVTDQSDGLCMASVDLDCERASQEQSSVSNKMKNMISLEETREAQINIQNCSSDFYKQSTINHTKQFGANSSDLIVGDPSSTASLGKASMRDLSGHALAASSILLNVSAIPEREYIWQGGFEVHRGGKVSDLCGGIQAHLSSYASPKVLEMVNKFPQKIQLHEEPRLSTWPAKFHESGAKEDNIALYFFAKDHESYERNYKCLVDSMMKNDLALKGDLDGVELLIFPSSQLPENCQRWNLLFFLWGVFRARKVGCSDASKNSSTISGLNMVPLERDVPSDVRSLSQNPCLPEHVDKDKDSPASDSSHDLAPAFSCPYMTGVAVNGECNNKVSCDEQTSLGSQAQSQQRDGLDFGFTSRTAMATQLSQEMRCTTPPLEELPVCGQGSELKRSLEEIKTYISSNKVEKTEMHGGAPFFGEESSKLKILPVGDEVTVVSEKMPGLMIGGRNQVDLERSLKDDDGYIDPETALGRNLNFKVLNCQQSSHHKRPHLDLRETLSENSYTSQKMTWKEAFGDGESTSKKPKICFSGTYGSSSRDRDSFSDGFSSHRDDLHPSSSVEDKRCDVLCDEKVIPEDLGTTERYFFPVDPHVKDFRLGSNHMTWKERTSKDEDQFHDGFPNLELALGAEKKPPNKRMLPFFVGSVDKNNNQDNPRDKLADTGKEEDVSASLSLSLSFPFPDKEPQTVKPVVKTEQLLHERRRVDTSLFLFGGLLDK
ncbi:uncharacterized protein LOC123220565 isoform X3 [Mangifera indica]|nr:uncharacterized protein LOC123220565 isoform X3 [Mangifera indica]